MNPVKICKARCRSFLVCLGLILAFLFSASANADWINLTGAETAPNIGEITVNEDGVRVALEIHLSDLSAFEDILPDELFRNLKPKRLPLDARLGRFSRDGLRIETDLGEVLPVRIEKLEPRLRVDRKSPFAGMINPQTRQRVPPPPADKRVIFAELFYAFAGLPKSLLFSPPRNPDGKAAVTIGFIAFHKSIPIIDFRYLSGSAKLKLDWGDPWYTAFDNPNLRRHHKDALMMFLYVEPRQLRQEALFRVRDLEKWTDLELGDGKVIEIEQQKELKNRATAFYGTKNPLFANERKLDPVRVRAQFVEIGIGGIKILEEPKRLDRATALIGLIAEYDINGMPEEVRVDWELFDERQKNVPATLSDPAGPLLSFVTQDDPQVIWKNSLKKYREPVAAPVLARMNYSISVPALSFALLLFAVISAACAWRNFRQKRYIFTGLALVFLVSAGMAKSMFRLDLTNPLAPVTAEKNGAEIVRKILNNLQVAILEHDPSRRADALETSIADESMADIEPEVQRALVVRLTGGGEARAYKTSDVTLSDISRIGHPGAFRTTARWKTLATGGHWGHTHRRFIDYQAIIDVAPINNSWKLTGLTVTEAN
jgi:hypothetical protein